MQRKPRRFIGLSDIELHADMKHAAMVINTEGQDFDIEIELEQAPDIMQVLAAILSRTPATIKSAHEENAAPIAVIEANGIGLGLSDIDGYVHLRLGIGSYSLMFRIAGTTLPDLKRAIDRIQSVSEPNPKRLN